MQTSHHPDGDLRPPGGSPESLARDWGADPGGAGDRLERRQGLRGGAQGALKGRERWSPRVRVQGALPTRPRGLDWIDPWSLGLCLEHRKALKEGKDGFLGDARDSLVVRYR